MTETSMDLAAIEHLDFEPEQDKSIRCEGFIHRFGGEILEDTRDCSNSALLVAFRGCCGMMKYFCQSCYNKTCTNDAIYHYVSEGVTHVRSTPKFSRIELL